MPTPAGTRVRCVAYNGTSTVPRRRQRPGTSYERRDWRRDQSITIIARRQEVVDSFTRGRSRDLTRRLYAAAALLSVIDNRATRST